MASVIGTGTTIAFDTGFFAEIVGVRWTGIQRGAIDESHMGTTGARVFRPTSLFDPGELEVDLHFAPATRPPIDDPAASCVVDFGTHTWTANAFMTQFEITDPFEDKMTATGRLKFSGNITIASG